MVTLRVKGQIIDIENVQRRATKFILNYPKGMSHRDRLVKLPLLPLEYRREMKDLVLICNAKAGHIAWVMNTFSVKP